MTTAKTKHFYLRTGRGAADRMLADIDLMGIKARLFINKDQTAEIFKINANNKIGKKPIAKGKFFKHPMAGTDKMPDIRGVVETGKGSKIGFVGWAHSPEVDPYYVLQVDEFVRKGKFMTFK